MATFSHEVSRNLFKIVLGATLLGEQAPRARSMLDSSIYRKEYIPSETCEPQYQVKHVYILFRSSESEYVHILLKTEFVPSSQSRL